MFFVKDYNRDLMEETVSCFIEKKYFKGIEKLLWLKQFDIEISTDSSCQYIKMKNYGLFLDIFHIISNEVNIIEYKEFESIVSSETNNISKDKYLKETLNRFNQYDQQRRNQKT